MPELGKEEAGSLLAGEGTEPVELDRKRLQHPQPFRQPCPQLRRTVRIHLAEEAQRVVARGPRRS